jgi:dipeptidyl aminopeptidase/acylaminoacyl peptidase
MLSQHVRSVALAALLASSALAQGSRADYDRAAGLRARFRGLLDTPEVEVQWADGGRRAVLVSGGALTLLDLESGERVRSIDAERFGPIDRALVADGGLLLWRAEDDFVRRSVDGSDTFERVPLAEVPAFHARRVDDRARSPRRAPDESELVIVNTGKEPVSAHWVDRSGALQAYAEVAPGARSRQHSFATHVWELRDARGQALGRFAVSDGACAVIVDASGVLPGPANAPERPRERAGDPPRPHQLQYREHNVFVKPRGADDWVQLTTDGTEEDGYRGEVLWSPDGTRAVLMRRKDGRDRQVHYVESAPRDQLQPKLHSYDYRKPGDALDVQRPLLVDAAQGTAMLIDDTHFPNPWRLSNLRWEPDGSRFTFVYNQRGHGVYGLIAVDASTAEVRVLIEERPGTFFDYANKAYVRHLEQRGQILWMSERSGWNHLYLFDARDGTLVNAVTSGEWVVRGVERLDEERGEVWLRVAGVHPGQDPYHVHYARARLDGSELTLLTSGDGTHEVRFSPDRGHLVDTYSRVDLPPVTELRRCSDGALVCELGRASDERLRAAGWRPPQRFVAPGRDGKTEIWGIIRRPTNFEEGRSYPVIESIYAGPQGAFVPKDFRTHSKQSELAELGFIVVQIDGMGTNHRSKAFHDIAWKNLADSGFPDRRLWIEAAARAHPELDLTRVGIYGGSAGGQSALGALLGHADFYHAAVADCGCHDNRMDKVWWNELWMGWPIDAHYEEQSNVTRAHELEGALLLIVGEKDENVDPASTMQVVDALIRADKDFDLLVMPGMGHGAGESPYGTRRRRDFFVHHLLGVEPRWQ